MPATNTISNADRISDFEEEIASARERMAAADVIILSNASPEVLARAVAIRDYNYSEITRYTRIIERLQAA